MRSELKCHQAHPIVLSKTAKITEAVIQWSHKQISPSEREMTLNNLHKIGIQITSANNVVIQLIYDCDRNSVENLAIRKWKNYERERL